MSELPSADMFVARIRALQAENAKLREATIEECLQAARSGFEASMENYVLIGPSGMAMQMINSIKALSVPNGDHQSEAT